MLPNVKLQNLILTLQGVCPAPLTMHGRVHGGPLNQRSRNCCAWTDVPLNQRRDDSFKTQNGGSHGLSILGNRWAEELACLSTRPGWCPLTFNVFCTSYEGEDA